MRDAEHWLPSKFVMDQGKLTPSRDPREINPGSTLSASLVAQFYTEAIPAHVTGHLLDLGCGKQPFYGLYRTYAHHVTGADWPNSTHSSPHLDLYVDLSCPLPFADASFDTVLLSDVLEHVPTPQASMSEIARVLKPGGKLLLNVPFLYWIHEAPHDYHRYTRFALERLCIEAGLELLELHELGGALDILADVTGKLLKKLPAVGNTMARVVQKSALHFNRMGPLAQITAKTTQSFPLGYALIGVRRDAGALLAT